MIRLCILRSVISVKKKKRIYNSIFAVRTYFRIKIASIVRFELINFIDTIIPFTKTKIT